MADKVPVPKTEKSESISVGFKKIKLASVTGAILSLKRSVTENLSVVREGSSMKTARSTAQFNPKNAKACASGKVDTPPADVPEFPDKLWDDHLALLAIKRKTNTQVFNEMGVRSIRVIAPTPEKHSMEVKRHKPGHGGVPFGVFIPADPQAKVISRVVKGPRFAKTGRLAQYSILGSMETFMDQASSQGEFKELRNMVEERQKELPHVHVPSKHKAPVEDKSFKQWNKDMEIRKKTQQHLAEILDRPEKDLLMCKSDFYIDKKAMINNLLHETDQFPPALYGNEELIGCKQLWPTYTTVDRGLLHTPMIPGDADRQIEEKARNIKTPYDYSGTWMNGKYLKEKLGEAKGFIKIFNDVLFSDLEVHGESINQSAKGDHSNCDIRVTDQSTSVCSGLITELCRDPKGKSHRNVIGPALRIGDRILRYVRPEECTGEIEHAKQNLFIAKTAYFSDVIAMQLRGKVATRRQPCQLCCANDCSGECVKGFTIELAASPDPENSDVDPDVAEPDVAESNKGIDAERLFSRTSAWNGSSFKLAINAGKSKECGKKLWISEQESLEQACKSVSGPSDDGGMSTASSSKEEDEKDWRRDDDGTDDVCSVESDSCSDIDKDHGAQNRYSITATYGSTRNRSMFVDSTTSQSTPIASETTIVAYVEVGSVVKFYAVFENAGTTAIRYTWARDYSENEQKLPKARAHKQTFYFWNDDGIIAPEEKHLIPMIFRSTVPGHFSESWILKTIPPLENGALIKYKFKGVARHDVHYGKEILEVDRYISDQEKLSICREATQHIFDSSVLTGETILQQTRASPVHFCTEEAFEQQNPGFFFHPSTIKRLQLMYTSLEREENEERITSAAPSTGSGSTLASVDSSRIGTTPDDPLSIDQLREAILELPEDLGMEGVDDANTTGGGSTIMGGAIPEVPPLPMPRKEYMLKQLFVELKGMGFRPLQPFPNDTYVVTYAIVLSLLRNGIDAFVQNAHFLPNQLELLPKEEEKDEEVEVVEHKTKKRGKAKGKADKQVKGGKNPKERPISPHVQTHSPANPDDLDDSLVFSAVQKLRATVKEAAEEKERQIEREKEKEAEKDKEEVDSLKGSPSHKKERKSATPTSKNSGKVDDKPPPNKETKNHGKDDKNASKEDKKAAAAAAKQQQQQLEEKSDVAKEDKSALRMEEKEREREKKERDTVVKLGLYDEKIFLEMYNMLGNIADKIDSLIIPPE